MRCTPGFVKTWLPEREMTMPPALLMGIDLGTSSTKTVVIDQDGHMLSCAAQEYDFDTPRPGSCSHHRRDQVA